MKSDPRAGNVPANDPMMQLAIDQARMGIHHRHGGPFGAVIVKEGKVLSVGHNRVLDRHDPTAHGEIEAIRSAAGVLQTHDLSGCVLYTTGEPCPMCLCACLWANIDRVFYGCTIGDNASIGFRDDAFDRLLGGRRNLENYLIQTDREACLALFEEYSASRRDSY